MAANRTSVEVVCAGCGVTFSKALIEVKRGEAKGRKNYCSRSCLGKANVVNLEGKQSDYDISQHCGNRKDEYTGFREFIRRAKARGILVSVTVEYIKRVWDEQKGICVYSGAALVVPSYNSANDPIVTASLDRVDSSKPYEEGNIQFISIAMNHAKNSMTHDKMLELIKLIRCN